MHFPFNAHAANFFSSSVIREELDEIKASALQAVDKTLQLEHYPLYTLNTDFFTSEQRKWSAFYADVQQHSGQFFINTGATEAYEYEPDDATEQVAGKAPEALFVMANVRAYFEVTYKVVNIPKMTLLSPEE